MNPRLLCALLVLAVGCSGSDDNGDEGETGGASGFGSGGFAGTGGGFGTGTGGTGAATGSGAQSGGGASGGGTPNGGAGNGANTSGGAGASAGGNGAGGIGAGGAGAGGIASGGAGAGGLGAGGAGTGGTETGGTGNGGMGTGGAGGSGNGGMAGMGTGGAPPDLIQSVLERNKHPNRDGNFVQPALTVAAAQKLAKDTGFNPTFSGDMWASPLYMENGPGGKGLFFAVTTENNVYALDETTGAVVWTKNIGSSPTANGVPCGNIHPLGIISTPVIDAASRTIYVAGAIGTGSISSHQIHALSVDDGTEKQGWPVTASGTSGSTTFSASPENQRSALSLVNGTLYVAYGGHVGDCGPYHGWVIGIDTKDPTKKGGWATLGQGEGIWAPGGLASDGNGVFAVTGNSTVGVSDHMMSDSEEVVRITGLGVLDRSNKNLYFPASWKSMDSADADFGAVNPIYLALPGATPAHVVMAISKDGHMYLLDPQNLGGMAGHLVDFKVASGSMSIHTAPAAYSTSKGVYVTLATDGGAVCPAGGASGKVVMGVRIPPGASPKPVVAWCAALSGNVPGPIATTTDGAANPIVWFMSGSTLNGVDGDTGASVFKGKGSDACNNVRQWTSLIAAKGRIVSGADGKLCSYSPH